MSTINTEYRVNNSCGYALFSITFHGGAALMMLLTDLVATATLLAGIACALTWLGLGLLAIADLRRHGLWRSQRALARISISGPRRDYWRLFQRSGQCFGPAVVIGGWVMELAICLRLRDESGHCEFVCVPRDAMNPQAFRRLRVAARQALVR